MRCSLSTAAALLLGCNASLAQVSTMGTTAMGVPTTPGVIVTSPLTGPGPFSATTQPGTPVTTLAPVPLASNPVTPGTFVSCATPIPQIVSGIPAVPITSMSAIGGATATITPTSAATMPASTTMMPATPLGTILTPIGVSSTGTVAPAPPVGSQPTVVCSSEPGGPPMTGAVLPLSTPVIPNDTPPGTIRSAITELATTSIEPNLAVVPTPNSTACGQSVTMDLANPTMMAPANATGASPTPGVSPPSGC